MSPLYVVLVGSACLFVYPAALWLYNHHADVLRWLLVCALLTLFVSIILSIVDLVAAGPMPMPWSSDVMFGSAAAFLMIAVLVGAETGKSNFGKP